MGSPISIAVLVPFHLLPCRVQHPRGACPSRENIMGEISGCMGQRFERIRLEFLLRKARPGVLSFVPASIGRWGDVNPAIRAQDDVGILGIDRMGTRGLSCECRHQNRPMQMEG